MTGDRRVAVGLLSLFASACTNGSVHGLGGSRSGADTGGPSHAGADGSARDGGGTAHDASRFYDAPFERPDATPYTPRAGTCGFDAPAFCDTFESGPRAGGRSGELDPSRWSVTRGFPVSPSSLDDGFAIGPTLLPACRANLPARALPDSEVLICDPTPSVPSRHLLTSTPAQNYGLSTYRIRQPFDFSGRTGTIKFDVSLENQGLGGWPAISISEDPSPAPSFDWEERGSGPKNGVEIEFDSGWCNTPHTVEVGLFTFQNYDQTAARPSFDCATPHAATSPDALNHVEIYVTASHLEVWASDPSPDGTTFPNFHMLYAADLNLPFERGSVNLNVRNHATMKYWIGSAWTVRWDNVGFDGPVIADTREYDVPDSLNPAQGLDGCAIEGGCTWRGDAIAENPGDDTVCATNCSADGEKFHVGYVVPRDDEPAPVALHIPGVNVAGATSAELVFAATYPYFSWNGVSKPPTAIDLRYRLNGGTFHDRPITEVEAEAFTDFSPTLGGAGAGAGFLNQVIDIDVAELKNGDNLLELQTSGTWTGEYRAAVTGVDLVIKTENEGDP